MATTYLYNEDSGERREFSAESMAGARTAAEALLRQSATLQLAGIEAAGRTGVEFPVTVSANLAPVLENGYDVDLTQEEGVQVTVAGWPTEQEIAETTTAAERVGSRLALI